MGADAPAEELPAPAPSGFFPDAVYLGAHPIGHMSQLTMLAYDMNGEPSGYNQDHEFFGYPQSI